MTGPGNTWAIGRTIVLRLLMLIGLGVSSALLADELLDAGTYCKFDEPCAAVAASPYGQVLGVPWAVIGLAGFAALLALSLIPTRWAELGVRVGAVAAGLTGATLLVIQVAVLRQACPYCLVVDVGAILLAVVAVVRRGPGWRPAWPWVHGFAWTWAGLAAGIGPLVWAVAHQPTAAPPEVRAHWVPDRVNVVQVTDFECPHCRRAHAHLKDVLGRPDIHFVRVVVAMPFHENAWAAARAYLAAVRQGKGDEMADALYTAPAPTPAVCRSIAARLGLDLDAYDRAVADRNIDAEIQANNKWVNAADLGPPFFWVQDRLLTGVPPPDVLAAAIDAARPPGGTAPPPLDRPPGRGK